MSLSRYQCFILPFSGAKASQFEEICADLTEYYFEAIALEYAGRGSRAKEAFFTDYDPFMKDIARQIKAKRKSEIPFCLLGFSIGGIFAYDLYAKGYLEERPAYMFICACERIKEKIAPISTLSEEEFWNQIISMGGVDSRLLEKPKYLKLFSKVLRADFWIGEQHEYKETDQILDCPVSVLYSESDTPYAEIKSWQEVAGCKVQFIEFSGDHFFFLKNPELLSSTIEKVMQKGI